MNRNTHRQDTLTSDHLALYLDEISRHDLLTADEEVQLAQAMEAGNEARQRLDSDEDLDPTERVRLQKLVRAGERARQRFVEANLRLVVANARRYAGGSVSMLDLIQEGNLGLITAVERFDWRKGFKFSTYATWWIRQAMQRAQANLSDNIRVPTGVFEIIPTVRRSADELRGKLGRTPTYEEIADETGLSVSDVERAAAAVSTVALETPVGEDGAVLADFIADDETQDTAAEVEARVLAEAVHRALAELPETHRRVLELRFGMTGEAPATVSYIASEIDMPEHQVRQLISEATKQLAEKLADVEELRAA
ncbi:MAG TPA: sigma-70 family RNA polymerase sigma factor [Acidimicrobiia bacterium]